MTECSRRDRPTPSAVARKLTTRASSSAAVAECSRDQTTRSGDCLLGKSFHSNYNVELKFWEA